MFVPLKCVVEGVKGLNNPKMGLGVKSKKVGVL